MSMVDDLRKPGATPDDDVDDDEDLTPLEVSPTDHRLQYTYGLWYIGKTNYQQYDLTLKKIGRFASVEQFWALYSHLENKLGGQWLVRLNKGLAARCWENLILAILGEQFDVGDEICGAGVSMRQKKDCISLWNRNAADKEATEKIRDTLRKVLNLPSHITLEYRYHKDVLQWVNTRDAKDLGEGGQSSSSQSGGAGGGPPLTPGGRPRPPSPTTDSISRSLDRGAPGLSSTAANIGSHR
ncbi:Eukaryotic translation initiation factor 4E type 2 [Orchesella cincta]|uniref:Eukaryotic translation initiation factor 4E type 2 n=1 Tax=Orchesella cincta TaxID=48709 RepID=A0A1D2MTB1_ORCCI|nr:Eukaryotic translation initiation factor 4E type 2 [Orchesella cincta]